MNKKICPICEMEFEPTHGSQKYCNECRKLNRPQRKLEQYERQRKLSHILYDDPEIINWKCDECGFEFKAPRKYVTHKIVALSGETLVFCSQDCHGKFKKRNLTCRYCGKSLADVDSVDPWSPSTFYCSSECEEKYIRQKAEKNRWVKHCVYCGKEFIRRTGRFCSQKCACEARKNSNIIDKYKHKYIKSWDELCEDADGRHIYSKESEVKREARWQVRNLVLDKEGIDIENSESPEEMVKHYVEKYNILFATDGTVANSFKAS